MNSYESSGYSTVKWGDCSWREIEERARQNWIVLVPLGSIEQHGPMLPVECDWFLAESWAFEGARLAKERYGVDVLVAPPIPYGVSTEHMDFPGTLTLSLDTYVRLLQDVIRGIARAGFRKIVCVSGHGGNVMPAQVALRDLKQEFRQGQAQHVMLYMADADADYRKGHSVADNIQQPFHFHASACETSYYLFQRPDLVKKGALEKPVLKRNSMPLGSWWTRDITESGASGDPSKANVAHGEEIFKRIPGALASFLNRVRNDGSEETGT